MACMGHTRANGAEEWLGWQCVFGEREDLDLIPSTHVRAAHTLAYAFNASCGGRDGRILMTCCQPICS